MDQYQYKKHLRSYSCLEAHYGLSLPYGNSTEVCLHKIVDRMNGDIGSISCVMHGNTVTELIDGKETFAEIYKVMATAIDSSHYICMLNWWLDLDLKLIDPTTQKTQQPDPTTHKTQQLDPNPACRCHTEQPEQAQQKVVLRDLLEAAANKGVQIRAMLWDQWGRKNTKLMNGANKKQTAE